jgi:hypothetical protein
MSNYLEKIKIEIDDLVNMSERLVSRASAAGSSIKGSQLTKYSMWVTRIGFVIRKLYGTESQHYLNYSQSINYDSFYNIHSKNCSHIAVVGGIILAIQHEFNNGLINDFKKLVQADVFSDFLQMAEHLLECGYKDSAAVIIGSVLEDTLRRLAEANGMDIYKENGKPLTMEPLNIALAKSSVIDKLVQKQITSWGELRNKAAHGHFDEYSKDQVSMMLLFVQKFCSDSLV